MQPTTNTMIPDSPSRRTITESDETDQFDSCCVELHAEVELHTEAQMHTRINFKFVTPDQKLTLSPTKIRV